jgi:cell division protein FtsZ
MIPYHRHQQLTIPSTAVKIIGLGGAGANMLERIALDGTEGAALLAINTDVRTLAACVAGDKIQLGRDLTKGLGAGGDPELGRQAMLEAETEIRAALRGHRIVFLCVGLGGGTGCGAAPLITRIAREEGAFVVVFATMPFAFEGRRRREQAETTLNELAVLANALVTFDNNRMGELVLAKQGIHDAFAAADHMVSNSIKAVIRLVIRPGIINIGLDDLMSALRTNRSRCLFGSGIAKGKDRASCALRNALASPLLDQGTLLKEAQTVLVHLSGGEDLTLYEVELLMQRLQKFVPESAHILFGAVIDPAMGDNLSVTLISALPEDSLAAAPRDAIFTPTANPAPDPTPGLEEEAAPSVPMGTPPPAPDSLLESQSGKPAGAKSRRAAGAAAAVPLLFGEDHSDASPPQDLTESQAAHLTETPAPSLTELPPDADVVGPAEESEPAEMRSPFGQPTVFKPGKRAHLTSSPAWEAPAAAEPDAPQDVPSVPFIAEHDCQPEATFQASPYDQAMPAAAVDPETLKLKLDVKSPAPQNEFAFDSSPRGRFEGQTPNVVDGEDLDLPPFLRKKK